MLLLEDLGGVGGEGGGLVGAGDLVDGGEGEFGVHNELFFLQRYGERLAMKKTIQLVISPIIPMNCQRGGAGRQLKK